MDDIPPITTLNWDQFDAHCAALAEKIRATQQNFDAIVAIQRGGCVTGVIMSHLLEIERFFTLGVRTTSSEDIRAPRSAPQVFGQQTLIGIKGLSVLLLDDVCATGGTLRAAIQCVRFFEPAALITGVTIWDGDDNQPCHADHYGFFTPGWVVLPWERPHHSGS
jgi:hypoxanthine phosphoribosyltransferase